MSTQTGTTPRKFSKVLIVNRGEIALRIIQALREMGIASVAIYSEADRDSLHRYRADYAVPLKGNTSAETYLDVEQIKRAIEVSGADAVHPGYGFLSENIAFARVIESIPGVTFIGPSADAMEAMGDKIQAKALMKKSGIPVTPGSEGGLTSVEQLEQLTDTIGYPMILKATAGGGGRGMKIVRSKEDLAPAFESCKREAQAYFSNPEIFAEKFVTNPKHIEIQIILDDDGNGVHLYERDCSVQRRHQKLIEEAPSPFLTDEVRERLGEIAIKAARSVHYVGVGTVEFIAETHENIYFMEMNTRIQVEHCVSELVTSTDIVKKQVEVAMGLPLGLTQEDVQLRGHAIEARINAEDPRLNFTPCPGTITDYRAPTGAFIRMDSHVYSGYTIPEFYDSMIGKLIVWGKDRDEAIDRLIRALGELQIAGVTTNIDYQRQIVNHPAFREGEHDTSFIEKYFGPEQMEEAQAVRAEAADPKLVSAITTALSEFNLTGR